MDQFYAQPGMAEKNITLDWYPVGTGPYMLTVNNPNRRMVLERNPNFHLETYPSEGDPGDKEAGLLDDAGKRLPFVDKVVYSLEKESIPYWNKFLQGYYDSSGISSDSFDQAVRIGSQGEAVLTADMRKKGIRLETAIGASTYYMGFNMLDPVVGGLDERGTQVTPGGVHRHRPGRIYLHIRQRARYPGARAHPAGYLRLSRRQGGDEPLYV